MNFFPLPIFVALSDNSIFNNLLLDFFYFSLINFPLLQWNIFYFCKLFTLYFYFFSFISIFSVIHHFQSPAKIYSIFNDRSQWSLPNVWEMKYFPRYRDTQTENDMLIKSCWQELFYWAFLYWNFSVKLFYLDWKIQKFLMNY